jgi:hypothetical protein
MRGLRKRTPPSVSAYQIDHDAGFVRMVYKKTMGSLATQGVTIIGILAISQAKRISAP